MGSRRRVLVIKHGNLGIGGVSGYLHSTIIPLFETGDFDITLASTGTLSTLASAESFTSRGIHLVFGNITKEGRLKKGRATRAFVRKLLQDNHYDVIDVNTGIPWFQQVVLAEGRRAGTPIRIAHTHSITKPSSLLTKLLFPSIQMSILRDATQLVACSNDAGNFMFGTKDWTRRGIVALNGINLDRFVTAKPPKDISRQHEEGLLIIHVGNFVAEKNHRFLLEVFKRVLAHSPQSELWLVGTGPLFGETEALARELGISDSINFLGQRSDVPDLMSNADVLVFPSTSEGLGIVVIEGQASGLPCVVSDAIPHDADVAGCSVYRLSLSETPGRWARTILDAAGKRTPGSVEMVRDAGYDIRDSHRLIGTLWRE